MKPLQPDVSLVVNIKESADEMVRAVEATGTEVSDFNKGNIKARSRMIAQYALAGARSGAVIGTVCRYQCSTAFSGLDYD